MSICDHHIWLQISNIKELVLYDTDRLSRLLPELADSCNQKPSLILLVDRKAKNIVIREMFPWNNVRRIKRDGLATLRVETSTTSTAYSIFFAESDPFAALSIEPEVSFLCHQTFTRPIQWEQFTSDDLFDIVHSQLLFLFVKVLCVFADDVESIEHVADRLKLWAILKKKAHEKDHTSCKVIIVKSDQGSSSSSIYDILNRMNVQFSLLRRDLMNAYTFITVLNLINSQMSSLARHRCFKELIRRQSDEMRVIRHDRECLYSTIHMSQFFTNAVSHLTRTTDEFFDFMIVNCRKLFLTMKKKNHLRNFLKICRRLEISNDDVTVSNASTILLISYLNETHNKNSYAFDTSLLWLWIKIRFFDNISIFLWITLSQNFRAFVL